MKLTITKDNQNFINLEFHSDITLEDFIKLCSHETGIPHNDIKLSLYGKLITSSSNKVKLADIGIQDDDMIYIEPNFTTNTSQIPQIDFSNIQIPTHSAKSGTQKGVSASQNTNLEMLKKLKSHFLNNPQEMALLAKHHPALVDTLKNNDLSKFNLEMQNYLKSFSDNEYSQIMHLNDDYLDMSSQEKIANLIHQKNIDANMEIALEHTPESFGTVTMLFVNIKLNDIPIKAFVDTGAQATLMSKSCAERCNLLRLVDKRWQGLAKGVGTQVILGRIHLTQMVIENVFIACSFSVLENQPMDVLLGLDILKRYHCQIDLQTNRLFFPTYGVKTKFLDENELPMYAQHSSNSDLISDDDRALLARHNEGQKLLKTYNEQDVQRLIEMGFTRDSAVKELEDCDGNVDLAAHNLASRRS